MPRLSQADEQSTRLAVIDLADRVVGSHVVGHAEAIRAAEDVVSWGYIAVLETAPDPQARLTAMAVRQLGAHSGTLQKLLDRLDDVALRQGVQEADFARLRRLVEDLHQRVLSADGDEVGDLDVLIADDLPWTFDLLLGALRRRGWRVAAVDTVAKAERTLRTRKVRVVVVDLVMPSFAPDALSDEVAARTMTQLAREVGGLDILRRLSIWSPQTAVIIWSANVNTNFESLRRLPAVRLLGVFGKDEAHTRVLESITEYLAPA